MRLAILFVVSGLSLLGLGQAQTNLDNAFSELKSSNPAIVKKGNDELTAFLGSDMPGIENETATLCKALSDSDPRVRMQASGFYVTVLIAAPEHNQVVLSCIPGLILAAKDSDGQTRNNALFALALNPAGPPAAAHDIFVSSLQSNNLRTVEVAASGLIREATNVQANHQLVEQALESAPDAKHRLNLLYAISGSGVPSETFFEGSQRFIYDPDPAVQQAAIDAVGVTGKDKSKVALVMQNVMQSSTANADQKRHAQAVLDRLGAS